MNRNDKGVPRFAVVGAGAFGELHLGVYRQLAERGEAELVGVATRTPESARRQSEALGIPGFTDFARMIDELAPDAVSIVTPDHLHCEMTCAALAAGAHVLVEKPMDTSVAGARRMADAARRAGRLLQVDFHKRFDPSLIEVADFVHAGRLGEPVHGSVFMEERITFPRDVINKWITQTNPNWLVGIHMYDVLRWVLGREVVRVYATARSLNLEGLGPDTTDAVQARLEFAGGPVIDVQTSWILPESYPAMVDQRLRLVGTKAVADADLRDRGLSFCEGAGGIMTPNPNFLQARAAGAGSTGQVGYGAASIECFARNVGALMGGASLDAIAGGWADGEDGVAATRIAAAVDRSVRASRPVDLDEDDED